jgi:hypothetical protein
LKLAIVKISPPFTWFQSLYKIELEVKFAYRHDVSGCATLHREVIRVTGESLYVQAFCDEADSQIEFELAFDFWNKVDPDTVKIEKRPVGKVMISAVKQEQPARWRTLQRGSRLPGMRLDLVNHEREHHLLAEHDDAIEDFEGHELVDKRPEIDADDMSWLHPPKGPGQFKQRKKKGKK